MDNQKLFIISIQKGIKIGILYSIIPSIGLGIIGFMSGCFILGFPIGIFIGIILGLLNGFVLGLLFIILRNTNSYLIIKFITFLASIFITFISMFLFIYIFLAPYNAYLGRFPDGLTRTVDYKQLMDLSVKIAIPISLLVGYTTQILTRWYIDQKSQIE